MTSNLAEVKKHMTQTSQVEAIVDRFEAACKCWHQGDVDQAESEVSARREELQAAIRAALASQQEVAAPVVDMCVAAMEAALMVLRANGASFGGWAQEKLVAALAASRVPVASLAEPMGQRSDKDYAVEHAECMATAAERFAYSVDALDAAHLLDGETPGGADDAVNEAQANYSEARKTLRSTIYEFRKRRDRTAPQSTVPRVAGWVTGMDGVSRPNPAAGAPKPKNHNPVA